MSIERKFIAAFLFLAVCGCASSSVEKKSPEILPPTDLAQPSVGENCLPTSKVILANNFSKDDLPVLVSTDHLNWQTVLLKAGEKKEFQTAVIPSSPVAKAKSKGKNKAKTKIVENLRPRIFVHTGTENELLGGGFYSISLVKDALKIERLGKPCPETK